jgi:V/A-type H+-transporting ATPase subunit D
VPTRELAPTRIALLELGEERATAREGHALLDEKRMLLATRMLELLASHGAACRRWCESLAAAEAALTVAFDAHGVRDLELQSRGAPPPPPRLGERRLFGVRVPQAEPPAEPAGEPAAAPASPQIAAAAAAFRALLAVAPVLATLECALWRLGDEYRRTERRAGAIEHLLLPELGQDIATIEAGLEAIDQEEAMRVRRARAAPRRPARRP